MNFGILGPSGKSPLAQATSFAQRLLRAKTSTAGRAVLGAASDTDVKINARRCAKLMQRLEPSANFSDHVSAFLMQDGSILTTGASNPVRGIGTVTFSTNVPDVAPLPVGLMGTPIEILVAGQSLYVLTDQGDVCATGVGGNGQMANGVTANNARLDLINATNITPRSGVAGRNVIKIATSGPGSGTSSAESVYFLCADGSLWSAGYNGYGQLADSTTTDRNVPTRCLKNDGPGNVNVSDAADVYGGGGPYGSVGYIDIVGKVRLAGRLQHGANGRHGGVAAANQTAFRPVLTTADDAASQLPANYVARKLVNGWTDQDYSITGILTTDKNLYLCGYDGYGQLGNNSTTNLDYFVKAGSSSTAAATLNGTVEDAWCLGSLPSYYATLTGGALYSWGYGGSYMVPNGATNSTNSTPVQATGGLGGTPNVIKMSNGGSYAGAYYSTALALTSSGALYTFGTYAGGDGAAILSTATAVRVRDPYMGAVPILDARACGWSSVVWFLILYANGEVFAFGNSGASGGQLGLGHYGTPCAPQRVRF